MSGTPDPYVGKPCLSSMCCLSFVKHQLIKCISILYICVCVLYNLSMFRVVFSSIDLFAFAFTNTILAYHVFEGSLDVAI